MPDSAELWVVEYREGTGPWTPMMDHVYQMEVTARSMAVDFNGRNGPLREYRARPFQAQMSPQALVRVLRSLWGRMGSRGGSPDVEKGFILYSMALELAAQNFGPADLTEVERWVLSYVALHEGPTHRSSLGFGYSTYRVSRWETDGNGASRGRPFEAVQAEEEGLQRDVDVAVRAMVQRGLLAEVRRDNNPHVVLGGGVL